jgi:hypothetical protein
MLAVCIGRGDQLITYNNITRDIKLIVFTAVVAYVMIQCTRDRERKKGRVSYAIFHAETFLFIKTVTGARGRNFGSYFCFTSKHH